MIVFARYGLALCLGSLSTLAVFLMLERLVHPGQGRWQSGPALPAVALVRVREEPVLQQKKRVKPPKPKPEKQPPRPRVNMPSPTVNQSVQPMMAPTLNMPLDLAATNGLNNALVAHGSGGRSVNANVMPLVHIDPVYPKRAKMLHKEGYVTLEYRITRQGTVSDIEVVKAEPAGLFESSARRALSKWKFRPQMENGRAVEQWARIRINFDLER